MCFKDIWHFVMPICDIYLYLEKIIKICLEGMDSPVLSCLTERTHQHSSERLTIAQANWGYIKWYLLLFAWGNGESCM